MKKALFLFITASCLFQIKGLAQKPQVGITAGATISNVTGRIDNLDNKGDSRTGFTVGMVVEAPIKKSKISFQPGIHYVQKGKYTFKTDLLKEADALRYADLLLNFIAYLGDKSRSCLYLGLGPQLGFNLPSKRIKVDDGERSELGSITFGNAAANDYRGIDYGANLLAGIRFKCGVTFAVNYTLGLRNLIPTEIQELPGNEDNHLRNGSVGIRIGYLFPATPKEKKK